LVEKPEGKRPLGNNRWRFENNIKMDSYSLRQALVNIIMNVWVSQMARNF
jgi:hypothetical protein